MSNIQLICVSTFNDFFFYWLLVLLLQENGAQNMIMSQVLGESLGWAAEWGSLASHQKAVNREAWYSETKFI